MEFPSVRKVMLSALSPPQNNVVALRRKSQWAVAHYTAHGSVDNDKFSIATMTRYIEELEGYIDLWDTIRSALWHVSDLPLMDAPSSNSMFSQQKCFRVT